MTPLEWSTAIMARMAAFKIELAARLPHTDPIYKHDNASVFLLIEKSARNTSVESTVKSFARKKDGRGVN